jgi:hypothetical protein
MMKKNKAAAILEMLNKGLSVEQIRGRMEVSSSYVHMLKKKMAHKAEEPQAKERIIGTMERKVPGGPATVVRATAEDRVNQILDQRAEQYGSFMASANVAIRLKGIMHNAIAQQDLHLAPDQLLALDMIAVKISRILTGNSSHKDSWLDIAGYAKLVADRLQGNSR